MTLLAAPEKNLLRGTKEQLQTKVERTQEVQSLTERKRKGRNMVMVVLEVRVEAGLVVAERKEGAEAETVEATEVVVRTEGTMEKGVAQASPNAS